MGDGPAKMLPEENQQNRDTHTHTPVRIDNLKLTTTGPKPAANEDMLACMPIVNRVSAPAAMNSEQTQ